MGLSKRALCFPRSRQIDTQGTRGAAGPALTALAPTAYTTRNNPTSQVIFSYTLACSPVSSINTKAHPLMPNHQIMSLSFIFPFFLIKLKTVILTQISIYSVLQKSKGKRKKETNKGSYLAQLCEPFVLSTCRNSLPSCTSTILTIYV